MLPHLPRLRDCAQLPVSSQVEFLRASPPPNRPGRDARAPTSVGKRFCRHSRPPNLLSSRGNFVPSPWPATALTVLRSPVPLQTPLHPISAPPFRRQSRMTVRRRQTRQQWLPRPVNPPEFRGPPKHFLR